MRVCMYMCLYVCMYVCIMCVCIHVCMYIYARMQVCVYVCVYVCMCVCMCICMYVCVYVCMQVVCIHVLQDVSTVYIVYVYLCLQYMNDNQYVVPLNSITCYTMRQMRSRRSYCMCIDDYLYLPHVIVVKKSNLSLEEVIVQIVSRNLCTPRILVKSKMGNTHCLLPGLGI